MQDGVKQMGPGSDGALSFSPGPSKVVLVAFTTQPPAEMRTGEELTLVPKSTHHDLGGEARPGNSQPLPGSSRK